MARKPHVRTYSRRRCGLCDEAREVMEGELRATPFEWEEIFIDGSDDLERRYGVRVPVVEVDGREEFEYRVDPERLHRLVTDGSVTL